MACAAVLVLINLGFASAQDAELANEYFQKGEYEKARVLYQKQVKNDKVARQVYKKYLATLVQLNDLPEAERFARKLVKANPGEPLIKAEYGMLLERLGKASDARKQFEQATDEAKNDPSAVNALAQYYTDAQQPALAEQVYLAGRREANNPGEYAYQLAGVYRLTGDKEKMLEEYLNLGLSVKNSEETIQNSLQDVLVKAEDYELLKKVLLERIQKYPNEPLYSDLLIWHYIQQKDFNRAFIQARSTDKRYKLDGTKLTEVGMIALQNQDYAAAEKIFDYVCREYVRSPNYPQARRMLIQAREELVKNTYPINQSNIRALIADYQRMLDELGRNNRTMEGLRNMALLYGFYLNEKDTAVATLQQAIALAPNDRTFVDKCKTDLGDVYLLKNEPWESALLYAQVEKSEKEQPLGYEAKLRNAKLSYYKGDFTLAQEHLDVLKMATSREIANDAMELSLLIQDNTGQDSTEAALRAYAAIELLVFQHRDVEAAARLTALQAQYKDNSLADEMLWLQAKLYLKENQYQRAVDNLAKIVRDYRYDILSDDAHFLMAKVLEEKLNEKEKAMELYQQHLTDYPGSIYTAEARKRFRALRKDSVN